MALENRSLFKDSTKWQHQAPHTEWRKWLCFERCFFVVGRNRSKIGNWSYSNVFALLLAYGKTQTTWTNLHSLKDNQDCSNISVKWSFLWLLCSPFQSVNTWVFKFGNAPARSKWSTQIGDVVLPIEFPPYIFGMLKILCTQFYQCKKCLQLWSKSSYLHFNL